MKTFAAEKHPWKDARAVLQDSSKRGRAKGKGKLAARSKQYSEKCRHDWVGCFFFPSSK